MINIDDNIIGKIEEDDAASLSERLLLYSLVKSLKPNVVVEIGTHKGLTALYMASALHENGRGVLHTTDPSDYGQEANFQKFSELKNYIKSYRQKGEELDIENVDFLFVDGFHQEQYVLAEMKHFLPRLSQKAVVVLHDCGGDNPAVGVNSAIKKLGLETAFLPTDNKMRIYGNFRP